MKTLRGRVAVVTGAASGIGRATSCSLARAGCDLALVDRDEAGLAETSKALAGVGSRVSTHVADVADRARMKALADEVLAVHEKLHIVVNNAGVFVGCSFEDHTLEDLDWIIGVNFWGVLHSCKFFLPHLRKVDEAHIVNVSSLASFVGIPTLSIYCATKAAVQALTEALFAELSGTHIGVTSVHPGAIRTNLMRSSRCPDPEWKAWLVRGLDRVGRPPELVGRQIVHAIRRRKPSVVIGTEAHLTDWGRRLSPRLPSRILALGSRLGAGPRRADAGRDGG